VQRALERGFDGALQRSIQWSASHRDGAQRGIAELAARHVEQALVHRRHAEQDGDALRKHRLGRRRIEAGHQFDTAAEHQRAHQDR